eukprot:452963-Alexandrium_andersonii.AAC.1
MSASLVGSEMCIRDRCSCPRGRRPRQSGGPALERPRPGHSTFGPARTAPCLLYTSDAADDM